MEPAFTRISNNLFELLEHGWKPAGSTDDPVRWHKRDFNKIADYLVNHTMDEGRSWYQSFATASPDFNLGRCNLLIHFDGGTRAMKCSASAWYIEAHMVKEGMEIFLPIAMSGTYLSEPVSSFKAELIGLDEVCDLVVRLVRGKTSSHTVDNKRARLS